MNGLLGLGIYQSPDELAKVPRATTTFCPGMPPTLVGKNCDGWKQAVERVL
jgi:glycerol kinase